MVIRAIIFDFDGLILDTEGPIHDSWQELYQSYGCTLPLSTWENLIGTAEVNFNLIDRLEEQLGYPLDRETVATRRRRREDELVAQQPLLPGVHEYLRRAQEIGLQRGMASSSSCSWVTGHLERLGLLGYLDCVCAADDVILTKPDPTLYRMALNTLGVRADQAFALEDSPNGILAAKRAGLYCVAVPNPLTHQLSLNQADLQINSLAETTLDELLGLIDLDVSHFTTHHQLA